MLKPPAAAITFLPALPYNFWKSTSSYAQIRATLLTMAKWDDALRARIGVMAYIQRRTLISRSVIAEVLAALRQGDYIRMEKGKLVCINRLPLDY